MTLMNSFHKTIKFTEEHSREEIIFLDTYVKRDGDSLYTDLYVKETATHSYLLYTSCHPQNCIQKGPYGQFLRIKRNCTKDADFEKHAEDMKKHYADRGYPDYIIQKAYEKARQRDHHDLIHGTPTPREKNSRIPLVLTYNRSTQTWWKLSRKTGIFCIIRQLAKNYSQINQCWLIAGTEICETTLYVPTCWNPFKQKKTKNYVETNVWPPTANGVKNWK